MSAILDQFFDPLADFLPPETAQRLIDLRLSPEMQQHIEALAAKATRGELSSEQREEYARIVDDLDLIDILKDKARAALLKQAS